MNLNFSRISSSAFAGTATIAVIVITQSAVFAAKSSQEIAQLANMIGVQVNRPPGVPVGKAADGSGFIIKREGNTYTVLTNDHVLNPSNGPKPASIRTSDGERHQITGGRSLGTFTDGSNDLALLTFSSSKEYTVATLGSATQAKLGSKIFVFGYPVNNDLGRIAEDRTSAFPSGIIWRSVNSSGSHKGGYTMFYTAQTEGGMSGGPVFDIDGRVIGVHGKSDDTTDTAQDLQAGQTLTVERKSGINAAVTVDAFLAVQREIAGLNVDKTPSTDKPDETIKNPQTADVFVAIGLAKENNKAAAIDNYTQAIRLDPKYSDAYYRRAVARYDQGDKQGAITDYNEAIRLDPNNAIAYYNRGVALYNLRNYQPALADFSQYLSFQPNDISAYYARGVSYRNLKDGQGMFANFDQIVRLAPNEPKAYFNRALARTMLLDKQGTIADFSEAIRLDPRYTDAYINRAQVRRRLGDREGAIQDLSIVLQIQPDNGIAYYTRGLFRRDLGDREGAFTDLQAAITIFQQKGDTRSYDKAVEVMQRLQASKATVFTPAPTVEPSFEQPSSEDTSGDFDSSI